MNLKELIKYNQENIKFERFLKADSVGGYVCPICQSGSGKNGTGLTNSGEVKNKVTCWSCNFKSKDIHDVIGVLKPELNTIQKQASYLGSLNNIALDSATKPTIEQKEKVVQNTKEIENKAITPLKMLNNKEFRIYIDSTSYRSKPDKNQIGNIRARQKSQKDIAHTYDLETLKNAIEKGHTITRALLSDTGNKSFIEQKLFIIDIDNEVEEAPVIRPKEALEKLQSLNLEPCMMYYTFSSTENKPKFRIILNNNQTLINAEEVIEYNKKLNELFIQADQNIHDLSRLIYGTNTKCIYFNNVITDIKNIDYKNDLFDLLEELGQPQEKQIPISTGFNNLDSILGGGLYPGLYILGAISSLGKTTFALQIADQIAINKKVLIYSLEMDKQELIAKSISRATQTLSTRQVLTGYDLEEVNRVKSEIKKSLKNITIKSGVGDIGINQIIEDVKSYIEYHKEAPVIFIDYLQLLSPYNDKASDKQNTDKAVLELKRLSRDYKTPVVAISSFNRDNYTNPVNMTSFKESGAIEYSSDVLLGLQYLGMDYTESDFVNGKDMRPKRIRQLIEHNKNAKKIDIECKILKNRNGEKGDCNFTLTPRLNTYSELVERNDKKIL